MTLTTLMRRNIVAGMILAPDQFDRHLIERIAAEPEKFAKALNDVDPEPPSEAECAAWDEKHVGEQHDGGDDLMLASVDIPEGEVLPVTFPAHGVIGVIYSNGRFEAWNPATGETVQLVAMKVNGRATPEQPSARHMIEPPKAVAVDPSIRDQAIEYMTGKRMGLNRADATALFNKIAGQQPKDAQEALQMMLKARVV